MNKPFTVIAIALSVLWTFASDSSAEEPLWTHELWMESQPNQEFSRWLKAGDGLSILEDSALVLDSMEGDSIYWRIEGQENDGDWDGSRPSTIEFQARAREIREGHEAAGQVVVSDGIKYYVVNIDSSEWHTYRVILSDGQARIFIDGDLGSGETIDGVVYPEDQGANMVYFGDGSGAVGGITEWKTFRWTNEGIFEPGLAK